MGSKKEKPGLTIGHCFDLSVEESEHTITREEWIRAREATGAKS